MPQLVPVIAVAQEAFDYLNISAAQAAANLPNGTTTIGTFIQRLLNQTAVQIVTWLGIDYTSNQNQFIITMGNGLAYMRFPYTIQAPLNFYSWDPANPTTAVINIGAAALSIVTSDPYTIYRNDKLLFDPNLEYRIDIQQSTINPFVFNQWPYAINIIQLEMVAILYRESSNMRGSIGEAEFSPQIGARALKYLDMVPNWLTRLRPFRRIPI